MLVCREGFNRVCQSDRYRGNGVRAAAVAEILGRVEKRRSARCPVAGDGDTGEAAKVHSAVGVVATLSGRWVCHGRSAEQQPRLGWRLRERVSSSSIRGGEEMMCDEPPGER
jgi:hypothetical protein